MMLARNSLTAKCHDPLRWTGRCRTTTAQMNWRSKIPVEGNPTHLRMSFASSYGRLFGRQDLGFKHSGLLSLRVSSGGGGSGGRTGGGGGVGGLIWSFLSEYVSLLAKYQVASLPTIAITSAFLTLVGDLICQLVIDQAPSLDLERTSIFTLLGLVLVGPLLHFWYLSVSALVKAPKAYRVLTGILTYKLLMIPTIITIFLFKMATREGRPSDVIPKLLQEWFSFITAKNWCLLSTFLSRTIIFVAQRRRS